MVKLWFLTVAAVFSIVFTAAKDSRYVKYQDFYKKKARHPNKILE
jgi:hypothetical protein